MPSRARTLPVSPSATRGRPSRLGSRTMSPSSSRRGSRSISSRTTSPTAGSSAATSSPALEQFPHELQHAGILAKAVGRPAARDDDSQEAVARDLRGRGLGLDGIAVLGGVLGSPRSQDHGLVPLLPQPVEGDPDLLVL